MSLEHDVALPGLGFPPPEADEVDEEREEGRREGGALAQLDELGRLHGCSTAPLVGGAGQPGGAPRLPRSGRARSPGRSLTADGGSTGQRTAAPDTKCHELEPRTRRGAPRRGVGTGLLTEAADRPRCGEARDGEVRAAGATSTEFREVL